ncbi:unnamed protein product [Cylindrotheca closterium]|uniref:DUF6824 domain-containing protein n=1 Tax=Cylindrotheca closterium TaxID=2856 RepID=A0AAD2CSN6_9STRA|nr:unnamed protein product [Cylindrotheca closterium]
MSDVMNDNEEIVDRKLINPNDVLSQKGKGRHHGNRILRETIAGRSPEFYASSLQKKKEIVDEIVLGVQGRFLCWDKEHRRYFVLTNEDAVTIVRKQFHNLKYKSQKQTQKDTKQETDQEPSTPQAAAVPSHEAEAPTGNDGSGEQAIGVRKLMEDLDEFSFDMEVTSLDSHRRFLASISLDMFDDEDTVVADNKVLRDKDDRSAKGMLLKLLSNKGGEQVARTLLSIVSSSELDDEAQETLKAAKKSLLQQQERPLKSPRHSAPATVKVAKPSGIKDNKTKSTYDGHSVISFQIEHDMQNIQIVEKLRMGSKKDRVYSGSMMDDKPHGMGSMIYDHGRVLIGNWANGVFQGQGCAIYENGDTCFGSFSKGKADGCVAYITKFSRYIGDYEKNTRHGKGLYNDIQMGIFNGDFVEGRFEGLGVHTAMNGSITQGRFKNWEVIKTMATISEADITSKVDVKNASSK